ncbi:MAG: potassium channel family protein, partial [Myxococcales bacterium]
MPLQIGVTAAGVAVKKAVHFDWASPAPVGYRFLLAGSLSLAYLAVAMLDSVTERRQAELSDRARVNARAASGLALLLLAPAGGGMSGGAFLMLVMAVNVAQVVFDMMLAPMVSSEQAELGARTTADIVREEAAQGRSQPLPRADVGRALRKGAPAELRRDLYFYFIEGSWWRVAAGFSFLFFFLNVAFAALYVMEPGSIDGAAGRSFRDAFFFSVQTMSTIGYGAMSPGTEWANLVVTAEAAVGMVGVAVVTGLVFAKLSRPRSGILFSEPLLLTTLNGKRVLMLRAGNTRGNEVV